MKSLIMIVAFIVLPLSSSAALFGKEDDPEKLAKKATKERQEIREMRSETLQDLYKLKPEVQEEVNNSEAVAVFSTLGVNILLLSTARGGGIVRETKSGEETYMRMFSVGGGFGLGIKDFRVVFVFHTKTALDNFMESGWDFSGQGDAAAEAGDKGASAEIAATIIDGVSLYQITENGLALQVTLQGTKYYKDKDLN